MQRGNGGQQGQIGQQGRAMATTGNTGPRADLEAVFMQAAPKLAAVVPKHTDVQKIIRLGVAATTKDPNLLKCTPATLLLSLLQIASLGLEPNTPLQQAYIWGTRNKKKIKKGDTVVEAWVDEAQPIIGYRGYILLATQAGDLADVDADVVYAKDVLKVRRGTSPGIDHEPFQGEDAGPMVGVYCTWTLPGGGQKFRYWPAHRINTYVEKFGYAKGQNNTRYIKNTYRDHREAMVLKGVIRDSTRFWPLSSERSDKVRRAFEIDEREARGMGPGFAQERALIAQKAPELLTDLQRLGDDPGAEVEYVEDSYEPAADDGAGEPQEASAEERKSDPGVRGKAPPPTSYGDPAENYPRT